MSQPLQDPASKHMSTIWRHMGPVSVSWAAFVAVIARLAAYTLAVLPLMFVSFLVGVLIAAAIFRGQLH